MIIYHPDFGFSNANPWRAEKERMNHESFNGPNIDPDPPDCFGEYEQDLNTCEVCKVKDGCQKATAENDNIESRFSEESIFQEGGEGI